MGTATAPQEKSGVPQIASIKFNGLMQAWYATGQGMANTFRIRRTELYFSGDITNKARWQIMVDPAKARANSATSAQGLTRSEFSL